MKSYYILVPLLASFKATGKPLSGTFGALHSHVDQPPPPPPARAADPPPAPTPLPPSIDGVLPDGSVINYTPNNPSNQQHSCWTPPLSRPAPSDPFAAGICSVCILQRNNFDGSYEYQLWARDNLNNAMGNMPATTVSPLDGMLAGETAAEEIPSVAVGGSPLQLWTNLASERPDYTVLNLRWVTPPHQLSAPLNDTAIPQVSFDFNPAAFAGQRCNLAGTPSNGAAVYVECFFAC